MNLIIYNIVGLFGFGILTFCLGIYRITNGRMLEITRQLNEKVKQPDCHKAQDNLKEYFNEKFDDLKETVKENGNGKK